MAEDIWVESSSKGMDSVVTVGDNDCLITVYAGAMGSVNWSNHPVYGKPCLEQMVTDKKLSLSDQIQSASTRVANARSTSDVKNKEPEPEL